MTILTRDQFIERVKKHTNFTAGVFGGRFGLINKDNQHFGIVITQAGFRFGGFNSTMKEYPFTEKNLSSLLKIYDYQINLTFEGVEE